MARSSSRIPPSVITVVIRSSPHRIRLERPENFDAAWKLARVAYWLGNHAPEAERRAFLEHGIRAAETARHVALGATAGASNDEWTVLTDPVGTTYCITGRKPR